ncbi:hypothetical protein I5907_16410 [Panacibacter sp. DH6]|uniref:Uncharacterized protein n=1 Tax=Panacibacter microcysteis TaxID=2793269 RepID=A0A931E9U7_9BACT|nr:hypothetical protein [Panacibacter microcysteis]MBG9377824.1 hypothetical protein [Panacibacter microcysteis]
MVKFYLTIFTILIVPAIAFAKGKRSSKITEQTKGSVVFLLDNSKNNDQSVEAAYIILDKYNRTGAGYVSQKFAVEDNRIVIGDLPEGKYYVDIFTKGSFKQHFSKVIHVTKKGKQYKFVLEEVDFFVPTKARIPKESADFTKTSIVKMR